jgi:hypothetical protein
MTNCQFQQSLEYHIGTNTHICCIYFVYMSVDSACVDAFNDDFIFNSTPRRNDLKNARDRLLESGAYILSVQFLLFPHTSARVR